MSDGRGGDWRLEMSDWGSGPRRRVRAVGFHKNISSFEEKGLQGMNHHPRGGPGNRIYPKNIESGRLSRRGVLSVLFAHC